MPDPVPVTTTETLPVAPDPARLGVAYALGSFLIWGLGPLYFKAIGVVPPLEILAHRVVWSVLLVGLLVLAVGRSAAAWAALRSPPRRLLIYIATTLLVSANWFSFIWGIDEGRLVEISLGYYINPLVNVLLGVVFLKERLSRRKLVAVAVACVGVLTMVGAAGVFPWLSLLVAGTFGFYALLRKMAGIDPLVGLLVETALLAPMALFYLILLDSRGTGAFGAHGLGFDLLLAASGAITAVPLLLFNAGARRLQLSTIGLMQYLAPTGHLLLGTLVYGEPFTGAHGVAFACIWTALGLYSFDTYTTRRRPNTGS